MYMVKLKLLLACFGEYAYHINIFELDFHNLLDYKFELLQCTSVGLEELVRLIYTWVNNYFGPSSTS